MQLEFYDKLFSDFKEFMKNYNSKIAVVETAPKEPTYPLVILDEIRNTPTYSVRVGNQVVSSLGYQFDIYAINTGTKKNKQIAREIAEKIDYFMWTLNGIRRTSFNPINNIDGGSQLYRITMVYSPQYYENKKFKY